MFRRSFLYCIINYFQLRRFSTSNLSFTLSILPLLTFFSRFCYTCNKACMIVLYTFLLECSLLIRPCNSNICQVLVKNLRSLGVIFFTLLLHPMSEYSIQVHLTLRNMLQDCCLFKNNYSFEVKSSCPFGAQKCCTCPAKV